MKLFLSLAIGGFFLLLISSYLIQKQIEVKVKKPPIAVLNSRKVSSFKKYQKHKTSKISELSKKCKETQKCPRVTNPSSDLAIILS